MRNRRLKQLKEQIDLAATIRIVRRETREARKALRVNALPEAQPDIRLSYMSKVRVK